MHGDLIDMGKSLSKYCVGMEGNISKTDGKDGYYIKASGEQMSNLNEDSFCLVSESAYWASKKMPSIEKHFHRCLLDLEGIKFVAHTHPTKTVGILCSIKCRAFAYSRLFPEQVMFNGSKSCFVPYAMPGLKLGMEVEKAVKNFIAEENEIPKLILLQNHGVITLGSTIEQCIIATEICEKAAEIFSTDILGNMISLTQSEIEEIQEDTNEKYRMKLLR